MSYLAWLYLQKGKTLFCFSHPSHKYWESNPVPRHCTGHSYWTICPALDSAFASLQSIWNFISHMFRRLRVEQGKQISTFIKANSIFESFLFLHLGNSFYSEEVHLILTHQYSYARRKKSSFTNKLFHLHIVYSVCEWDANIYKVKSWGCSSIEGSELT